MYQPHWRPSPAAQQKARESNERIINIQILKWACFQVINWDHSRRGWSIFLWIVHEKIIMFDYKMVYLSFLSLYLKLNRRCFYMCICIAVYVCTSLCLFVCSRHTCNLEHGHVCTHMCEDSSWMFSVFLDHSPLYFLRQGLFLNLVVDSSYSS